VFVWTLEHLLCLCPFQYLRLSLLEIIWVVWISNLPPKHLVDAKLLLLLCLLVCMPVFSLLPFSPHIRLFCCSCRFKLQMPRIHQLALPGSARPSLYGQTGSLAFLFSFCAHSLMQVAGFLRLLLPLPLLFAGLFGFGWRKRVVDVESQQSNDL
jgi:hypothetical protein